MASEPDNPRTGRVPSREEILRFVAEQPGPVGRREIARAFGVKGSDRTALRRLLAELADEGLIGRGARKRYSEPGTLPPVGVVHITKIDNDGLLHAAPVSWTENGDPPPIMFADERRPGPAPALGDRFLVRLQRQGSHYEARVIRRLQAGPSRVIGVYTVVSGNGRVLPTDKRAKHEFQVRESESGGARNGELVEAEILPGRRLGLREVRVLSRLGDIGDPRSASLIAIHAQGIPDRFSEAALAEADRQRPLTDPANREDLRHLPLVTMDGADARDFDDAIWAAPDPDPDNRGGWNLIVAIADVAHYVRAGGPLDREARERGNSVYFPDRVVPMLPEALSNELCSLKPEQDRPVMAVAITIDRHGQKRGHRFMRAIMRSAARLIYEQAQDAINGAPSPVDAGIREQVLKPVYGAWSALMKARAKRQPLDLDLPELQVRLGDDGSVESVQHRARVDAHRVVEEYMILANVCAAETLEAHRMACMYRIHDEPDRERLRGLREFMRSLNMNLALGQTVRPEMFNRLLQKAAETPHAEAVSQAILRSQAQACYSPDNIGHFGLNLARYAHFTSPIRRYSDLLVHRGLIRALSLGDDGLSDVEIDRFQQTAEQISGTERRAMAAERDANDRYLAAFMAQHVGAEFPGRISGVTGAGLFIRLTDTGADGLLPISTLGAEYFRFDESGQCLTGDRSGTTYRLGDPVRVLLREANVYTGGLIFALAGQDEDEEAPNAPRRGPRRPANRGRKPGGSRSGPRKGGRGKKR